jgi:hypothetical protein
MNTATVALNAYPITVKNYDNSILVKYSKNMINSSHSKRVLTVQNTALARFPPILKDTF